jgi:hypothetical protein
VTSCSAIRVEWSYTGYLQYCVYTARVKEYLNEAWNYIYERLRRLDPVSMRVPRNLNRRFERHVV